MPKFANEEHAKEFMEARMQYREASRELISAQKEFQESLKQVRINQLVEKELNGLPTTKMFKSSGRLFISANKQEILGYIRASDEMLSREVVNLEKKIQTIEKQQKVLESSIDNIVEKHAIKE